jgi:hypothetical protein
MRIHDDAQGDWDEQHLSSCPLSVLTRRGRGALYAQIDEFAEADWICLYRAAIRAGADAQEAARLVEAVLLRAHQVRQIINLPLRARLHSWMIGLVESAAKETSSRGLISE